MNTADVASIRAARLAELVDAAEREHVVARALDALADVVADAELPVSAYGPVWGHVEARLRRDAHEARRRSLRARARVDDVHAAIDARARFDERSTT